MRRRSAIVREDNYSVRAAHLSSEDRDKRLRFLKGFEIDAEDKVCYS